MTAKTVLVVISVVLATIGTLIPNVQIVGAAVLALGVAQFVP